MHSGGSGNAIRSLQAKGRLSKTFQCQSSAVCTEGDLSLRTILMSPVGRQLGPIATGGRGFESRRSRQFFESAPYMFVKTSEAKLLRVFL